MLCCRTFCGFILARPKVVVNKVELELLEIGTLILHFSLNAPRVTLAVSLQ